MLHHIQYANPIQSDIIVKDIRKLFNTKKQLKKRKINNKPKPIPKPKPKYQINQTRNPRTRSHKPNKPSTNILENDTNHPSTKINLSNLLKINLRNYALKLIKT